MSLPLVENPEKYRGKKNKKTKRLFSEPPSGWKSCAIQKQKKKKNKMLPSEPPSGWKSSSIQKQKKEKNESKNIEEKGGVKSAWTVLVRHLYLLSIITFVSSHYRSVHKFSYLCMDFYF